MSRFTQGEKINCGEVVKAIILNGLGFVAQPLYLFPNFFKDKAVEHLLGQGVRAEDLNDDKLGRAGDIWRNSTKMDDSRKCRKKEVRFTENT